MSEPRDMKAWAEAEREQALELAKAVTRGECSTFGDEVPMSRALVSYAVENERLRGELQEATRLLTEYPWGHGSTMKYVHWNDLRVAFLASQPSPEAQQ